MAATTRPPLLALLMLHAAGASPAAAECSLRNWPGVQPSWRHGGASEKCFCAYAGGAPLDQACPHWKDYVSADGTHADKLSTYGRATIQGKRAGNATTSRYGSMTDWALDLGSGFGADCDRSRAPTCRSVGAHVLSIPRNGYASQCCEASDPNSFAAWLTTRPKELASTLQDMIAGGLRAVDGGVDVPSCDATGHEPTEANDCLAQCFHVIPDVWYAHLHTTVSVAAIREAPVDSGLGPAYNASERDRPDRGYYNVCACEPSDWPEGRGNCPAVAPADRSYPRLAAMALCLNLAAAAGVGGAPCVLAIATGTAALHLPRLRPVAPRAVASIAATVPCPALALGTGEGGLGDGVGVGITGVAWLDTLFIFFILGICGLIYTTTIEDFGSNADRTSAVRMSDEWAKALEPEADEDEEDPFSSSS